MKPDGGGRSRRHIRIWAGDFNRKGFPFDFLPCGARFSGAKDGPVSFIGVLGIFREEGCPVFPGTAFRRPGPGKGERASAPGWTAGSAVCRRGVPHRVAIEPRGGAASAAAGSFVFRPPSIRGSLWSGRRSWRSPGKRRPGRSNKRPGWRIRPGVSPDDKASGGYSALF